MNARIQSESLRFCSRLLYWEALNLSVIGYVCRRIALHYNSFNERLVWQSSDIILLASLQITSSKYTVINSSQPYLARVYVKMYKTVVEAYVFFFSFEGAVVAFYSYWCET